MLVLSLAGCAVGLGRRVERDLRHENYERAVRNLHRLLSRDLPDDERAAQLVRLAVALEEGGMAGEDDPVEHASEAIRLAPGNAVAHLVRAQLLASRGRAEAVADADAALARAESPDAALLAAAGDVYMRLGALESAITVYERALMRDPDIDLERDIHRNLAIAYRDVLDFENALVHSDRHLDALRRCGDEPSANALAFHTTVLWLNNDIDATVTMLNSGALPPSTRRDLIETFADPNLSAALAAANRRGR